MKEEKTKILIIEDDQNIGEMLKTILEFKNYEAVVLNKPEETKEKVKQHEIDLILLDLRLSGVMGTEVCANLKNDETTKDIPVLMMSALYDAGRTCLASGADDFISKPFEMDDLLAKVQNVLSRQDKSRS